MNFSATGEAPNDVDLPGQQCVDLISSDNVTRVGTGNQQFIATGIVTNREERVPLSK